MARWFRDRSPDRGIPSVRLRDLLPDARFLGCRDLEVFGCATDSRWLEPGELFVAIRDEHRDGHDDVRRAMDRGASGAVVDHECPVAGPLQVVVPDTRLAHARLCHALAGNPAARLPVVAVAGATGRSLTASYLRSIFAADGRRFGHIGADGWTDGCQDRPLGPETGCAALAEMLAALEDSGCAGVIVELSPDALRRRAADAIRLDGVIVTGTSGAGAGDVLLPESLRRDYSRLVRGVRPGGLVAVNGDDRLAELLGATNLEARRVAFGSGGDADGSARVLQEGPQGSLVALTIGGSTLEVSVRPAGRRGVEGALAAACFAVSQGIGLDAVAAGLAAVDRAPGQLERVELVQPFDLWIEGSPDPSEWLPALRDIRRLTSERLICVLTVPDREPPRAGMLRACEAVADQILLTAEHPDRAPSEAALDEVLASFRRPGRVRVEPSRERAIEAALEIAEPGDSVLLTGGRRALRALDFRRPSRCDDRSLAARIIQRSQTVPRRRSA